MTGAGPSVDELPLPVLWVSADGRQLLGCNVAARSMWRLPAIGLPVDLVAVLPDGSGSRLQDHLGAARDAALALVLHRLIDGEPSRWALSASRCDCGWVIGAQDLRPWAQEEQERTHHLARQRDWLVREVHHRIKNNLQGLAGLLHRLGDEHPALREPVARAVAQVRTWSQVYGLHAQGQAHPSVQAVLRAAAQAVQESFGCRIGIVEAGAGVGENTDADTGADTDADPRQLLWAHLESDAPSMSPMARTPDWRLVEADATPMALCLNELLTNAVKHGTRDASSHSAEVDVELHADAQGVRVLIRNRGHWPSENGGSTAVPSRDPHQGPKSGGPRGLDLVRALLPRRGARLDLAQEGPWVCARLHIGPPCIAPADGLRPQSDA